jgi:hypothetical protein
LRQSHLTYYFPTRVDLVEAVARAAIEALLGTLDAAFAGASQQTIAAALATVAARHESTRVLLALAQAADEEPRVRALFRELADGVLARADKLLTGLGLSSTDEHRYLMHAVAVGLAVVGMATARPDGKQRATNVLDATLKLLALEAASRRDGARDRKPAKPGKARRRARDGRPILD